MKRLALLCLGVLLLAACYRSNTTPGRVGQMYFATISFVTNSNEIEQSSYKQLDQAARIYKKDPTVRVLVRGYTDSMGDKEANLNLSRARAQQVARALQERGVPEEHLLVRGYGAAKPVASNNTPEGRQQNRRVEIEFPYPVK